MMSAWHGLSHHELPESSVLWLYTKTISIIFQKSEIQEIFKIDTAEIIYFNFCTYKSTQRSSMKEFNKENVQLN